MRRWNRVLTITVPVALLGIISGCGGGQSVSGTKSIDRPNNPPVAALVGYTPNEAPLVRFKPYRFQASAADPDIGDSISKYEWDFGDGTGLIQTTTPFLDHTYSSSGGGSGSQVSLKVRAYDNNLLAGSYATTTLTLDNTPSPIQVSFLVPTSATLVQADPAGGVQVLFKIQVTSTSIGTISLSGITFKPGDAGSSIVSQTSLGGGQYSFLVRYQGDVIPGTRTVTPTVLVQDSIGILSSTVAAPAVTITTLAIANHAPVLTVTNPVTPTSQGYTSKPIDLEFTITDVDNDVVNYSVDWGDGTPVSQGTANGTTASGIPVVLQHSFPDSFTTTSRNSTVTITASDGRSNNGTALPQTRTFTIFYNAFPTAAISTPQASGTLPSAADLPSNPAIGLVNPPGPNDPDILVIPSGGKLKFDGNSTLPGSQDLISTFSWTFQGGTPSASATQTPDSEILFPGNPGAITAYLAEFKVTDALGRSSSQAPGVNPKTFRKWIVVDGRNTQLFKMNFMYRQISDNNGIATLTPIALATNGLGVEIRIFQDGVTNTYAVEDQAKTKAQVAIPVRSNLPFYVLIPKFNEKDGRSYLMRIPNAPTGAYADPSLGTSLLANASSFGFENSSVPWNPTLKVVTAQGFSAETAPSPERRLLGTVSFVWGTTPTNSRYFDRLSVPLDSTDSLGAIPADFIWSSNSVYTINGARAQQSVAEWTFELGNRVRADTPSTAGGPAQMRFTIDYAKYTGDAQLSETFAHERMQVFRVPPGVTDPYSLDVGGWLNPSVNIDINPVPLPASFNAFITNAVYGVNGSSAFSGGLQGVPIPYDANDPNRSPYVAPRTYGLYPTRSVLGYAEYLWSTVWARPLILNVANPNYLASWIGLPTFAFFRNSNPVAWPAAAGIVPDNSAFDMTVSGAGTFDASSPVAVGGATPSKTGVGRFYWTAFTPFYNAASDSLISRTWLSDDLTGRPPTTITGGTGDALAAFGFLTPQDTVVDKRGRNANGTLMAPAQLGGYRVTWFNPTKDPNGDPVAPDFWVVEFQTPSGTFHYLLPSGFPAGTQQVSDLILTDARTYLPSGRAASEGPLPGDTDTVAPGYCWFDVPLELRPSVLAPGTTSYLRVFALKSILKNSPPAGARALNRPDWMDAIKTALPEISIKPLGNDITYAHKIPFNFYWDIVVVNGPRTPVAP